MKGDKEVIEFLNKILANELVSIHQYYLHAKIYKDMGFQKLHDKVHAESIEEMKHADIILERILFLDGLPDMRFPEKLSIAKSVESMLKSDLKLEYDAMNTLRPAVIYCENSKDFGTRDLVAEILKNEEEHIDWLETQIKLIHSTGEENYLQLQV
jgi:bacterioferritin